MIGRPVNCAVGDHAAQRALEFAHVRADALGDEERHLLGQLDAAAAALLIRIATRVSKSGGSIATVRPQPKRDFSRASRPCDFFRVAVAGQDDLLLAVEQRVERVEEFFLRAVLAGEELDVVDQQRIERPVRALELVDRVVLQRLAPCR